MKWESSDLIGICSTIEKAIKIFNTLKCDRETSHEIEEFEIDSNQSKRILYKRRKLK